MARCGTSWTSGCHACSSISTIAVPVRLDDLLDIEIWISRIGRSSIRFELAMKKQDGQLAAEGYLVIVAISRADGKSVEVPKPLVKALEPYTTAAKS